MVGYGGDLVLTLAWSKVSLLGMPGHACYAIVALSRSRCSRIHRYLEERRATPPLEDAAVASATTVL